MSKKGIKQIFKAYPEAKELYMDANGVVWVNKDTAKAQSKGDAVKTLKRKDYK